ncbi:MAG: phosphotransferase enzyme family protein [Tumebacillaceae bacterium]
MFVELLREHYGIFDATLKPIENGVMNRNFIVTTPERSFVLKEYATRLYQPEWILRTCAAQERVQASGVPVPRIIRTVDEQVLCQTQDGFYLLSEFVAGQQHVRMHIPAKAAFEMGRTLGRLLDVLSGLEDVTQFPLPDALVTAEMFENLAYVAERHRHESSVDEAAYQVLRGKVQVLRRLHDLPARLGDLPAQWVHGDYQENNVIFDQEDRVAAVIDFDNLRCRPRGYEVMRTMSICFFDDDQLLPEAFDFFAGVVQEMAVSEAEVATYAPLITYMRLVNDWPIRTRYENRAAYDPRWDRFIGTENGWWERHMDELTERLLGIVAATHT